MTSPKPTEGIQKIWAAFARVMDVLSIIAWALIAAHSFGAAAGLWKFTVPPFLVGLAAVGVVLFLRDQYIDTYRTRLP